MTRFNAAPTRRGLVAGLFLAPFMAHGIAHAAIAPQATLSSEDQADLERIQAYLNNIKVINGVFEQTNPDGSTSTGKIWLSRPGKMRFEYDPPTKMLIVCDGDFIEVNDGAANDIQFVAVKDTPAWLILRDGITLSGDVTVTHFERGQKSFRVTVIQNNDKSDSALTMVFSDTPLLLKQWTVSDPQRGNTSVSLLDLKEGGTPGRCTFVLPDSQTNKHNPCR
jgi:outer membrane lipoprotein-sorting protein